jgi:hypothetical protein
MAALERALVTDIGARLTWDGQADQFTGRWSNINWVRPELRIRRMDRAAVAPRSSAKRNGPSRSTILACCAMSSAGAIPSDVLITPPTMIRKPRRFASSASARLGHPTRYVELDIDSLVFPAEPVEIGKRPAGFVSAEQDRMLQPRQRVISIGRQRLLYQCNSQIDEHRYVFAKLALIPALVGIDDEARRRRRLPHRPHPFDIAVQLEQRPGAIGAPTPPAGSPGHSATA